MSSGRKILIGALVVVVLGSAAAISVVTSRNGGVEVRLEEVGRRDLVSTVTASGNIRARRAVDISADVMGRVIELNVEEGDDVTRGEVLLRIDPSQLEAAVSRAQAALSQAEAQAAQQQANLTKAAREYERIVALRARDSILVSPQQVEDAETNLEVSRSLFQASQHGVDQARAALEEAEDQLSKTIILAPISGKVTRLNVEEGETVVIGTMNNPGSLILTISDLSVVEAVVEVDETDVPEISLGDSAVVALDAFPDREFAGRVTEIGNSAIVPPSQTAGTGQTAAIDFEVVITLESPDFLLRPDLSATADIVTAVEEGALAIPIIALTVREPEGVDEEETAMEEEEEDPANVSREEQPEGPVARGQRPVDVEGVFLVRDGVATFRAVQVGITGQEYFQVLSGLEEGDTVVAGPYQRIRDLEDGQEVKRLSSSGTGDEEESRESGS
jgi:HlyD family secretion protein